MNELEELFKDCKVVKDYPKKFCRTCKHRRRFELNEYSPKIVQCCECKPSKRSNSGYKTIKVTDAACIMYEEESK